MASMALAFDILARDKGASRTFDKVADSAERAGKKGEGFGSLVKKGLGIAAAAFAATGVVRLFGDVVTAGSDLEQAIGGAEAVFKKSFGGINQTAEGAADSLGLSREAYLKLATVLGAGLKNKGLKDYAEQTQNLLGIGADLAAQYGGSTQDAVDALASAMRGESDPIERYGISLNETAVNAYLAKKGLDKLKGPALEQAKAQARVALITAQSADALGAFGRESDTYAGKQARLTAKFDNLKQKIGTALLPIMVRLSEWFLTKGLPALERFGSWFIHDGIPALQRFGTWIKEKVLPPVQEVGKWFTEKLWPALKEGYETVLPALKKAWEDLTGGVDGGGVKWREVGAFITDTFIPLIAKLVHDWLPVLTAQWQIIIATITTVWKAFETWRDVVLRVVQVILDRFADLASGIADFLRGLSQIPGFGWAKDAADKMDNAADKARRLAENLNKITDKSVTVSVSYVSKGTGRFDPAPTGYSPGRAKGGPVRKGVAYAVGENPDGSWNNTTELFVAGQSGQILNQKQIAGVARASGTGWSEPTASGIDYYRLAEVLMHTLGKSQFLVEPRAAAQAVNQRNATRARY